MRDAGMPHSLDAEREVLAAVLVDPRCAAVAIEAGLTAADFYLASHATLWRHVAALSASQAGWDEVVLVQRLKDAGDWERIGCAPMISGLLDRVGSVAQLASYAAVVRAKADLRRMIEAARDVEAAALAVGAEPSGVRELAEVSMLSAMRADADATMVLAADVLDEVLGPRPLVMRLKTGIAPLDAAIGGLPRGYITTIPARPAMGKSSILRQIIAHGVDGVNPRRQVVFSLEMTRFEVMRLIFAEMLGTTERDLAADLGQRAYIQGMEEANRRMREAPLWIDESGVVTADDIVRRVRAVSDQHGPPDVIAVDHFHLLAHGRGSQERGDEAPTRTAHTLRALAKDTGAAVVVLAQMTKQGGRNGRPTLEEIHGSDGLATDSALVVSPWRPEYRDGAPASETPERAELVVTKARFGGTGVIPCQWHGRRTRYA